MSEVFLPPSWIGVVGGGQLGMMLIREAQRMGYRTAVWDPDPECPASRLADVVLSAPFADTKAADALAARTDVITYEFENVDPEIISRLERVKPLYPGSDILRIARHRRREKEELKARGFPVVAYRVADSNPRTGANSDVNHLLDELTFPVVLKTATSGYDGKGQVVINDRANAHEIIKSLTDGVEYVAEEFLDLECEISALVVRSKGGEMITFPLSENLHKDNILHITRVPARVSEKVAKEARELGCDIARSFNLVGLLCVEMFVTKEGKVLVNELAPRPHNSGHYSLDACSISQFEALVRTMCGLSVPEPRLITPCAMINLLGKHLPRIDYRKLSSLSGAKLHLYGKTRVEPKRKMGHVTIVRETPQQVEETLSIVAEMIGESVFEEQQIDSKVEVS